MANKIPHVLIFAGVGLAGLGVTLLIYQKRRERQIAEAEAAQAAQAAGQRASASSVQAMSSTSQAPPLGPKIPITVFADEGVPMERGVR